MRPIVMIIFDLYYKIMVDASACHYFFSDIAKIVEFLNHHDQCWGLHWQTVVVIQVDTNERQPIMVPGYDQACDTFKIDRTGKMKR